MTFKFLDGAQEDLRAARRFYEAGNPELGQDFGNAVRRLIGRVVETPLAGASWPGLAPEMGIRRRLMRRFPFALAYYLHGDTVVIAAVVHTRQQPHWLERIR